LPTALLAALTTAVGFGVFRWSGLASIALLGTAVAVAVLVGVPVAYAGLRPLLAGLPLRPAYRRNFEGRRFRAWALWSVRRRRAVWCVALLVLGCGAWTPTQLERQTNALHYFPAGERVRDHFVAIEADGTALSSVEVLARAPANGTWTGAFDDELEAKLEQIEGVSAVLGASGVQVELEQSLGAAAGLALAPALKQAGRLSADGAWRRWTVRFPTAGEAWTAAVVERVRVVANEWAEAGGVELHVAGSVSLLLEMQARLLGTLASSLAWTVLATSLLLLLVVRSLRAWFAAFVVNLFPVGGTLTLAYVAGFPLDGATVMVAAVVLGLAVDNTLHLLHGGGRTTRSRLASFERVGSAALVSSLALTVGFAVLSLSGFAPTARFGLLCSVGALFALIADLVLLPALWIGPARGGDA